MNNLPEFSKALTGAWVLFVEEMCKQGWLLELRDNSNVHLERHERGKNKGFYQCAIKQFWHYTGDKDE